MSFVSELQEVDPVIDVAHKRALSPLSYPTSHGVISGVVGEHLSNFT